MLNNVNGLNQDKLSIYLQQHIDHHNNHQQSQQQQFSQQNDITDIIRNKYLKPSASGKDISNKNNQLVQNQLQHSQQVVNFTTSMIQNQSQNLAKQYVQNKQIEYQNQTQINYIDQETQSNKYQLLQTFQVNPDSILQAYSFHGNDNTLTNNKYSNNQEEKILSQKDRFQNTIKDENQIEQQKYQYLLKGKGEYIQQKQMNGIQSSDNKDINCNQQNTKFNQMNDKQDISQCFEDIKEQQQRDHDQNINNFRKQKQDERDEESQLMQYDDEQDEDIQLVVNKINSGEKQNENFQDQQTHVESFKLEIEKRFQKSKINSEYRFPIESSQNSLDSESSLISLKNVNIYDLNLQNLPQQCIQNSSSNNQVGSNNLNFKHQKYEQQNQQTKSKQQQELQPSLKNMKIRLSERNLNSQIENNISQQLPSQNSQNKLRHQNANINNTNQSNMSYVQNTSNINQKSQQNIINQQGKTLKKNDQTKSFSDLRATSANTNNSANIQGIQSKMQGNQQLTNQIKQNENCHSLGRLQNNNSKQQQQLNNQKQPQNQQIHQILQNSNKNLNNINTNEQQRNDFSPQQISGNNYYLTERWKKESNEYSKLKSSSHTQNYNQIIADLSKNLKKQDNNIPPDDQFQDNNVRKEQFLNVNQLLENSGHQILTETISNNINSNNFQQENQSQNFFDSNQCQINEILFKKNQVNSNITNHEVSQCKQKINSSDKFSINLLNTHKTLNYQDNRSRQLNDTELQNRIMKMKQNLDEKLRQSTSRTNERTNYSQYISQKPQQQCKDIFQKMKTIIQNDTTGNPSTQSSRNTQKKDKNDTSKSFETKKGVSSHLQNNLNISININNNNNFNQNSNQQQNSKVLKEQNLKTKNLNNTQHRLDRNSSTKQLTNKSQSKEKQQSNSKQLMSQVQSNINLSQNQLPSANRLTITSSQTPQSHSNKQISSLINQEQGFLNLDSHQSDTVLESQVKQNSHSKTNIQQNLIQYQQTQYKQNASQTPQNAEINQSCSINGTMTVTTATTNGSNANSTINPQIFLNQNQKTSQNTSQQIQGTISGLKQCLNNKKEQNNTKNQHQLVLNQVIQKQQEQLQQNKISSYKSSGNLLKNYSNSNLKIQTCRNITKPNIRDVRLKLNDEGQARINNCKSEIQNNNSFNQRDISLIGPYKNNTNILNIGQNLQTQDSQQSLLLSSQKNNNIYNVEVCSLQNNTINKSLLNCPSESNILSNIQKQSQQTATNTSRLQNTSRERETGYIQIQTTQLQQYNLNTQPSIQQNTNFGQNGQQQQLILQIKPQSLSPNSHTQQIQQSSSNKQNTIQLKNLLQQQQNQAVFPVQSLSQQNRANKDDSSAYNRDSTNGNRIADNFLYQKSPINDQINKTQSVMSQIQVQNQNYINNKSPSKVSINQQNNCLKETNFPFNQKDSTNQANLSFQKQDQENLQGQYNQSQTTKTNLLQQIMQKTVNSGFIKNNNYLGEQFNRNDQEENFGPIHKSIQQYKKAVEINLKSQQSQQQQTPSVIIRNGNQQNQINFEPSPLRNISKNHQNYSNKVINNTANSHYQYLNNSNHNQNGLNMNNSINNNYLSNNLNGSQNIDNYNKISNSINNHKNNKNGNEIIESNNILNNNNTTNFNIIDQNRSNLNKTISVQKNNFMLSDNYIKGLTKNFSQKQLTSCNSNQFSQQPKLENKQLLQSTEFNNSKSGMKLKDIGHFCQINQSTCRQQNTFTNSNLNSANFNADINGTELNNSQNKCESQKQLQQSKSYGIYSQETQSHYQTYLQQTQLVNQQQLQTSKQQQQISNYSIQMSKELQY